MTPNPHFKGTPLFDVEYLRNTARYSYNSYKPLKRTKRHHFMIKNRKKIMRRGQSPLQAPPSLGRKYPKKPTLFSAFKLTWKYVWYRICHSLCSEFVNSFARRQQLFDIAAKPIDVDWNFLWLRYYVTFGLWHRAVRLSSVTLFHSRQRLELFGNIFAPPNSSGNRTVCVKILDKNSKGVWKIGVFRPISRIISKTVQDTTIVMMEDE